jgi:glycosyltransferase involved in cell wall biosynthesis
MNLGGPALQVTSETGFKISAATPADAVVEMASAMRRLAGDPALRRRMGDMGRQRVWEDFNWERRAHQIARIYQRVLGQWLGK